MFMDFNQELLQTQGHGDYTRIPTNVLPPLWLGYVRVRLVVCCPFLFFLCRPLSHGRPAAAIAGVCAGALPWSHHQTRRLVFLSKSPAYRNANRLLLLLTFLGVAGCPKDPSSSMFDTVLFSLLLFPGAERFGENPF